MNKKTSLKDLLYHDTSYILIVLRIDVKNIIKTTLNL